MPTKFYGILYNSQSSAENTESDLEQFLRQNTDAHPYRNNALPFVVYKEKPTCVKRKTWGVFGKELWLIEIGVEGVIPEDFFNGDRRRSYGPSRKLPILA